jgi:methionyl-tRNA formyltransferase
MRLIFMGTPGFAVPTLEALHRKGHEIAAVFCQPDRPSGRGRNVSFSPVKQRAMELNLPVCQPATLKDTATVERLTNLKPDVLVVVAYGLLLPQNILDIPKYGAVNLHPSLLPKYRGAAPINHALLHGDKVTGITSILMNSKMDAGDIILQEQVPIRDEEDAGQLDERLAGLGAELILKSLDVVGSGISGFTKQEGSLVTYAPKLTSDDGHIDWSASALDIQNQVRGMTPSPGAFAIFQGRRLEIIKASIGQEIPETEAAPGQVVQTIKNVGLAIKTGDGIIILLKVKPQGKREMTGGEFVRGYRPRTGEALL